jgi:starch synthase
MPIIAMSARLVAQKGLDLVLGDPGYFALDAQFLFLGSGEPRYEAALSAIAERAPNRISVQLRFSDALEHRLLAGADMCLMPSQYEPCGLTQMRAQRYGAPVVARNVGGLRDTVDPSVGFLFEEYSGAALSDALTLATQCFEDAEALAAMRGRAMSRDFSWSAAVPRYADAYRIASSQLISSP